VSRTGARGWECAVGSASSVGASVKASRRSTDEGIRLDHGARPDDAPRSEGDELGCGARLRGPPWWRCPRLAEQARSASRTRPMTYVPSMRAGSWAEQGSTRPWPRVDGCLEQARHFSMPARIRRHRRLREALSYSASPACGSGEVRIWTCARNRRHTSCLISGSLATWKRVWLGSS